MSHPDFLVCETVNCRNLEESKSWMLDNIGRIEQSLLEKGAVLVKGLSLPTVDNFHEIAQLLEAEKSDYSGGATPRLRTKDNVFTATETPQDHVIHFHNELAYSDRAPQKLVFYCEEPAEQGGETVLVDGRRYLDVLDNETLKLLKSKEVIYKRRLRSKVNRGFGMSWQDVFNSEDKTTVEQRCNEHHYDYYWESDFLILESTQKLIYQHPETDKETFFSALFTHRNWFNPMYKPLYDLLGANKVSTDAQWADGSEIDLELTKNLYDTLNSLSYAVSWEKGDILFLDNFYIGHSRNAYKGSRKLFVSMLTMRSLLG